MTTQNNKSDEPCTVEDILHEYMHNIEIYRSFTVACNELLQKLIEIKNLNAIVHSITCRVKDTESLRKKLERPDKHYKNLSEITDLSGIRIITYYADDVDIIGAIIEREFRVDWSNSIDKGQILDPDRFGYLSFHYICRLKEDRIRLPEYNKFNGYVLEIQVRSILQHAWAEIEHDLGYKSVHSVPDHIQRRFSRLAGLLEIGDSEFSAIRKELFDYRSKMDAWINMDPSLVQIDAISIDSFCNIDPSSIALDKAIAEIDGARLFSPQKHYYENDAATLKYCGLSTIKDVQHALNQNRNIVIEKVRRENRVARKLPKGIGILHLFQVLLADKSEDEIVKGFEIFKLESPSRRRESAIEMAKMVKQIKQELLKSSDA